MGSIPSSLGDLRSLMQLALDENSLTGSIPSSLANVIKLTELVLLANSLTGPIPSSLGDLRSLTLLSLEENSLTGPIPSSLGDLRSLKLLGMDENLLTGPFPTSLTNLAAPTILYLYGNSLTGPIPSSLGDLRSLKLLGMDENFLTGTIPSSLGNLIKLTQLALYENSLTGSIPSSLGDLTALTELPLEENSLTGPIPSSLGDLTTLTLLYLYENSLMGPIPSSLGDLAALTGLNLNGNSLTGPIPSSLGDLTVLAGLYLYGNSLTGPIPSSLSYLTALTILYLYENSLTGPIPSLLGDLRSVTQLVLYENSLTGPIPSLLGDLTALTEFTLYGNSLTGPIPSSLGDLTALTGLSLEENSLTGPIPSSLGQLKELTLLSLSSNSLGGTIPSSLGFLEKCLYINMSSNTLTGPIPVELGNIGSNLSVSDKLVGAGVALDLSQNALSGILSPGLFSTQLQTVLFYSNCMQGSLPPEICSSRNLQTLVLDGLTSGNTCQSRVAGFKGRFAVATLQGSIPECVWTMPLLQTLHFSGNGLHGSLADIGNVSSLINVDVSNNFLTGTIPTSLQTQPTLQQLALANNKLTGILSPSFVVGNNLTLLQLAVNRLSGDIPASFTNTPGIKNFSVLTGNLFSCGNLLPTADLASGSYVCGSQTLNDSLYICGSALLILMLLGVFAFLHLTKAGGLGCACACVDQLLHEGMGSLKPHTTSVLMAPNLSRFVGAMEFLRVLIWALGLFYLLISMPAYAILKSTASAGILAYQYTWVTTSAFLHDYASMVVVGLFVALSCVLLVFDIQRLDSVLKRDHTLDTHLSAWSKHLKLRNVLQRLLVQTVSLVVVLLVNILYVYGVVFGGLSASGQFLLAAALGLFKLLWQQLFVTRAISWIAGNHDDVSEGGLLFHQVAMSSISFIVAPCLATLGTDSDCLYDALLGSSPIFSYFDVTLVGTDCATVTTIQGSFTKCFEYLYKQPTTILITPPWFYSYQCTSALITNYMPALLIAFVTNAIGIPLLRLAVSAISKDQQARSALLKYLSKQSLFSCRQPVADILLDLLVLMTFGMAAPLLGLMIVVKQFTTGLLGRMSIGRYLQHAEDPAAALARLDDAANEFRVGDTRALLGFLLTVVGIFWGAMIFDMVADLHGNTAGRIAWAVAFAVWTTVAALAYWTKMGSIVEAALSSLFARVIGAAGDELSAPLVPEMDKNSMILVETKNVIFNGDVNGDTDDDRLDNRDLNSTFGHGRDSEVEMI